MQCKIFQALLGIEPYVSIPCVYKRVYTCVCVCMHVCEGTCVCEVNQVEGTGDKSWPWFGRPIGEGRALRGAGVELLTRPAFLLGLDWPGLLRACPCLST